MLHVVFDQIKMFLLFFVIGTQQNQSLENTGAKSMNLYSETEVIMTDDTQKNEQLSIDI